MPQNISYTNIASILLKQINLFRNDPQLLIPILQQRKEKYDQEGNYFPLPGLNFSVKTKDGLEGINNLIQFIERQRECPQLQWSYELHQAADKRCSFLGSSEQKNALNRIANLQIGQVVSQFTTWKGNLVELTFYGFIEPREFICELLLEDGRQEKENRVEFFNRVSSFIGIGINTHEKYRFVIILIMAMQVANHEPIRTNKNIEPGELLIQGLLSNGNIEPSPAPARLQFQEQPVSNPNSRQQIEGQEGVNLQCRMDDCRIY